MPGINKIRDAAAAEIRLTLSRASRTTHTAYIRHPIQHTVVYLTAICTASSKTEARSSGTAAILRLRAGGATGLFAKLPSGRLTQFSFPFLPSLRQAAGGGGAAIITIKHDPWNQWCELIKASRRYGAFRSIMTSHFLASFDAFDLPVFWPILLAYFILLVTV